MNTFDLNRILPDKLIAAIKQDKQWVFDPGSTVGKFKDRWKDFVLNLNDTLPGVITDIENTSVRIGELSPGCEACKTGRWDCIFITSGCNLNCSFCCNTVKEITLQPHSAYGNDLNAVIEKYKKINIKGISFSGGEPFLNYTSMLQWFTMLKKSFPDIYFWIYTNGVLVKKQHLDSLAELGLNEIRFNLAATGYSNKKISSIIEYAASKIPGIVVEIPVIPADTNTIKENIKLWETAGVKYLNLHELMHEPASNSICMEESFEMEIMEDGHKTGINSESKYSVLHILKEIIHTKSNLNVNVCSLINKINQVKDRRSNFALLSKKDTERITDNEYLVTVLFWKNENDYGFIHPDKIDIQKKKYSDYSLFRIKRLAPLSNYESDNYVEIIKYTI